VNIQERDEIAARFGVAPAQVERDHLISFVLAFLSAKFQERLHFIGGTALARTHLPHGRLSEDIDLIAVGDRSVLAYELDAALPRAFPRTHGRLVWTPPFNVASDVAPASLRSASGLSIKIQLLSPKGRALWPVERHRLVQRYSDAPVAELLVPTLPAFVASKTVAWRDRGAPRDLWDLWALSEMDAIDAACPRSRNSPGVVVT